MCIHESRIISAIQWMVRDLQVSQGDKEGGCRGIGVSQALKTAPEAVFWVGACCQHTAQRAQFRPIEIISEASRYPKDVPFEHEF